jgi:hypothetical protein
MTDEQMRDLIMGHTAKEIRSAANALGVTLGYSAGRKEDAAGEIVAWMRHTTSRTTGSSMPWEVTDDAEPPLRPEQPPLRRDRATF